MKNAPVPANEDPAGGSAGERALAFKAEPSGRPDGSAEREVNTVLLVDDEHEICLLLASMLERAGTRCVIAHTVAEARAALSAQAFDAAFLDVNLPDGLGFSLIPEIKTLGRGTVCVAVSAMDNERHRAMDAGADTFVAKPFDREMILSSLRDMGFKT